MTRPRTPAEARTAIVSRSEDLYYDLALGAVRAWKEETGRPAVGCLPVYVPREVVAAAGVLPVGLNGGGDQLEIIRGDSYYQSYICHLPRSIIEMGLGGHLDALDGMIFPSTCDVIRNLSGMWQILFPGKYVRYLDVPQSFDPEVSGRFYAEDLRELATDLHGLGGWEVTADRLEEAIVAGNANRAMLDRLYSERAARPWQIPASETHLLVRAGNVLPFAEHTALVGAYLDAVASDPRPMRDGARVAVSGSFCEQPPLRLLRALEQAGCFIVDDDMVLGARWFTRPVDEGTGDPFMALSRAFLDRSVTTAVRYQDRGEKGAALLERVRACGADGVIFAAASFCDPALLEQPMLQVALDRAGIPHTQLKFSEDMGQIQVIAEQAGTFADSIRLWGAT